ncbi:GIY-YIG nuclease family protein [Pseudomonas sp. MYb185]|uniref:GIY-YIG nuclease family protein n=1 Tax=Pseudomonas sp. MYb185 TaxID=1848729 RepID=UPI000CFB5F1A|nr:GIY-YIG nuclease family protein [Pseudomonas sp. MYb185]PRB80239.1 endonuclease [Pseudomonas sp. MYb185]
MNRMPCVYILASKKNGTLYVGVTSNLPGRIWQHREKVLSGFTARYGVDRLVWFEPHESMEAAILREKQLKAGSRQKKIALIIQHNPEWTDLYPALR